MAQLNIGRTVDETLKYGDLILDYDPALGNQVVISYAAYNSNNPLVK